MDEHEANFRNDVEAEIDSEIMEQKNTRRKDSSECSDSLDEIGNEEIDQLKQKYNPEYNLRKKTIVSRIKVEKNKHLPKVPKPKASPAPLSKYRRRAANARERNRMEDINQAFDTLKAVLPNIEEGPGSKMTKITTLRLAMNYITALRDMLGYNEESKSSFGLDLGSEIGSDGDSSGTPSVSSGEEPCLSPDPTDGNFLTMDFLSDIKLDDFDTENLLLDST